MRPSAPAAGESMDELRRDFGVAPPPPGQDPFADVPAAHDFDRLDQEPEPRIDPRALRTQRDETQPANLEPPPEPDEAPARGRVPSRREAVDDEGAGTLGRSYGSIIKAAIAAVLVIGLIGFGYWQRSTLIELYQALRGSSAMQTRPTATPAGSQSQPKISDRIGQPSQDRRRPGS